MLKDRRKTIHVFIKQNKLVCRNINECWLDTNFHKGYIDADRHFAGIKLRGIYEKTTQRTIVSYKVERIDWGRNWVDPSIARLNALDKLKKITLELGRSDYDLAIEHCGLDKSYGQIGKSYGYTRQTISKKMKIILKNLFTIFNNGIVR